MGMFKLKDIQARLDILSSTKNVELLNGDLLYKYTFDTMSFNTYNYDGIEIITFFVHDNKYIEVTYKYLNAIMTKAINLVKHEDTKDVVFYLDSFSILNELFSVIPNYVDYVDMQTLCNGFDFVEKQYLKIVDTDDRFVTSGKSFVGGNRFFVRFYTIDFDGKDAQGENKYFVESLLDRDLFKGEESNISNLNEIIKYVSD
nr:MAG TPA: hypothetical protein [Bacteriophage sp.]